MTDETRRDAREILVQLLDIEQDGNGFGEYQADRILAALAAADFRLAGPGERVLDQAVLDTLIDAAEEHASSQAARTPYLESERADIADEVQGILSAIAAARTPAPEGGEGEP